MHLHVHPSTQVVGGERNDSTQPNPLHVEFRPHAFAFQRTAVYILAICHPYTTELGGGGGGNTGGKIGSPWVRYGPPDEQSGVATVGWQAPSPIAMRQAASAVLIDFPIVLPFFCGWR